MTNFDKPQFLPQESRAVSARKTRNLLRFGLILMLVTTVMLLWLSQKKEILASITLNTSEYSSETAQEIQEALLKKNSSSVRVLIEHQDGERPFVFLIPLQDMGFAYEPIGESFPQTDLERITPFFHSSAKKTSHNVQLTVDKGVWKDFLEDVEQKVAYPAQDGKIVWTEEKGWVFLEAKKGRALDQDRVDALFAFLTDRLSSQIVPQELTFTTQTLHPSSKRFDTSLEEKYPLIHEYVRTPITLVIGEDEHVLDLNSKIDYLSFNKEDVHLNLRKIRAWVRDIVEEYYVPSSTVTILDKEEVRPNVFQAVTEGDYTHGQRVSEDEVMAMIEGYLTHQVSLAVNPDGPRPDEQRVLIVPIHDIPVKVYSELAGTELDLLSVGFSEYSTGNNVNRVHNIKTGLKRLNKALIPAGQKISFNRMTGSIDNEFRMGYAILGSEAAPSLGGGICQVSTTFYRGLLKLGVPITQRQNHSWDLSYYREGGYGLDATIFPAAGLDVKAENNLDSDLFLYTYTVPEKEEAYVLIYGVSDGRQVQLEPHAEYIPHYGAKTIKWTQTIEMPDGEKLINDIVSRYRS